VATRFVFDDCGNGEELKLQLSDIGRVKFRPTFWVKGRVDGGDRRMLQLFVNGVDSGNGTGSRRYFSGMIPGDRQSFDLLQLCSNPHEVPQNLIPDRHNRLYFTGRCDARTRRGYLDITQRPEDGLCSDGSFNTNNDVWVRLNDHGQELYLEYHHIPPGTPGVGSVDAKARLEAARDEDSGCIRLQLHELMAIFGPHMGSFRSPFVDNEILFRRP